MWREAKKTQKLEKIEEIDDEELLRTATELGMRDVTPQAVTPGQYPEVPEIPEDEKPPKRWWE
jgi:hypothetical protein